MPDDHSIFTFGTYDDTADSEWREAVLAARDEYEQAEGCETPRGTLDRRSVVGLPGSGCEARPPLNIEELAASIRAHHEILQAKRIMVDALDYLLNLVHDEIIVGSGNILEVLGMLPYYREEHSRKMAQLVEAGLPVTRLSPRGRWFTTKAAIMQWVRERSTNQAGV